MHTSVVGNEFERAQRKDDAGQLIDRDGCVQSAGPIAEEALMTTAVVEGFQDKVNGGCSPGSKQRTWRRSGGSSVEE